jgi:hypothetical protein
LDTNGRIVKKDLQFTKLLSQFEVRRWGGHLETRAQRQEERGEVES